MAYNLIPIPEYQLMSDCTAKLSGKGLLELLEGIVSIAGMWLLPTILMVTLNLSIAV